jgi:undecaprenyl-diphosphatase
MSKKLLSKIWISSILLTILISIVLFLIWHDNIIDYEVYNKISNLINPTLTNILIFITNLSSTYVIITVISLLFWYFLFIKKNSKLAIISFIIPVITILLNQWLKYFIQRPRPNILRLIEESGTSFPSGHSMMSMIVYWMIALYCYYFIKNKTLRIILVTFFTLLILAIWFSRIYLWVHYFSDVVAWFIISLLVLISISWTIEEEKNNN